MFSPRFVLRLLALLHVAYVGAAASPAPAARPLAAALLVRAGAGFRVTAREPAPAGETPWDEEAEGRRLAEHNTCGMSCDDGAFNNYRRRDGKACGWSNTGYMRRRDFACYLRKSVCLSIVNIGVVQLLLAVFATLGSVRDLFDLGNMREDDEKPGRLVAVNSSFIFVPAALDILLAALDFAIFTQQARAETEALATRSAADSHSHLMLLLEPHPLPTASRVGATYGASRSWTSARSSA